MKEEFIPYKEEFIPYNQALALKKLGFEERCFSYYVDQNHLKIPHFVYEKNKNLQNGWCLAPIFSQAFRWIREKYGLESYINPELPFSYNNPKYTVVFIQTTKGFITYTDNTIWVSRVRENIERKRFSTHKEAELECLKKLIEIIESKSE